MAPQTPFTKDGARPRLTSPANSSDCWRRTLVSRPRDFLGGWLLLVDEVTSSLRGRTFGPTLLLDDWHGRNGTVRLAHRSDGRFSGQVALKVVNQAVLDVRARTRFEREGTILARLTYPNIARLRRLGDLARPALPRAEDVRARHPPVLLTRNASGRARG